MKTFALKAAIEKKMPQSLTPDQANFLSAFEQFIFSSDLARPGMILKGYAGTGKSTMVARIVHELDFSGRNVVLLAPTGRAAKVLQQYSGKPAFTIHRYIYMNAADEEGRLHFRKRRNTSNGTLFIIDEASMIADRSEYTSAGLLQDLLDFIFEKNNNYVLFVGDDAQLPPVHALDSPALQEEYLKQRYFLDVKTSLLTQVVRQEQASGILYNATELRQHMMDKDFGISFRTKGFPDFYKMGGDRLEDGLRYAYNKYGEDNTILITRSNKLATGYNKYIRFQIKGQEDELAAGDLLMIVKNNYTVLPEDSPAGFLANGEFVEISKILRYEDMHGFRFATVELALLDYPTHPRFTTKIFLDTLYSNTPALSAEEQNKLYQSVRADYANEKSRAKQNEAIKADPFYNALQVKFAYALTCHKAQGGQWGAVFVDQGFLTEDKIDMEFLRWLYTALTRATQELFLVNFNERFFENS